ncbi:hypothetical protein U9M48_031614 [Paspalum notatum var. saurae]|uniref:Uncharacterized protein n=1 Tax=Paspalum notatum var. saurae TaxID=547442 RepID=A0AAQ3X4J3_PASNO
MWKKTLSKVEYGSQLLHTFTNELHRPIYSPICEGILVGGKGRWEAEFGGRPEVGRPSLRSGSGQSRLSEVARQPAWWSANLLGGRSTWHLVGRPVAFGLCFQDFQNKSNFPKVLSGAQICFLIKGQDSANTFLH